MPQFIELGHLRAESIKRQLDGAIPSTSAGQNADNSKLVDASSVNLSALGSMMGGGGRGDMGGWPDGENGMPSMPGGMFDMDMEVMMKAMQIIEEAGGELTDEVKAALLELGITDEQIDMFFSMQNGFPGGGNRFPGGQGNNPQQGGNTGRPGGVQGGNRP